MKEIKIYHSIWKNLILVAICLAFVVLGVLQLLDGRNSFLVWASTLFFGIGGLFMLYIILRQRITNKPYYVITDESTVKDEEGMINITRSHYPQPFEVPQDMFYSFPFAQGATYSERNIKYRSLFDLTIINVDSFQTGKPFSRERYPASSKNPELVEPNGIPFSNKEYYISSSRK